MGTPQNDRKKKLGEIAHKNGLCNVCRKNPIFREKSTVKCERCFVMSSNRTKEWGLKHKDRMKEYHRKSNSRPEAKLVHKLYWLKYRETEHLKNYRKTYYANNKEHIYETNKLWIKNHLEESRLRVRLRASERRYRKKTNGGTGKISRSEWTHLLELYGNQCLCCGATEKLELDHIVPLMHGGKHDISNIQPLCRSCNSKKMTKVIDYRLAYFSSWT